MFEDSDVFVVSPREGLWFCFRFVLFSPLLFPNITVIHFERSYVYVIRRLDCEDKKMQVIEND